MFTAHFPASLAATILRRTFWRGTNRDEIAAEIAEGVDFVEAVGEFYPRIAVPDAEASFDPVRQRRPKR
jgi:hypothetical protein